MQHSTSDQRHRRDLSSARLAGKVITPDGGNQAAASGEGPLRKFIKLQQIKPARLWEIADTLQSSGWEAWGDADRQTDGPRRFTVERRAGEEGEEPETAPMELPLNQDLGGGCFCTLFISPGTTTWAPLPTTSRFS